MSFFVLPFLFYGPYERVLIDICVITKLLVTGLEFMVWSTFSYLPHSLYTCLEG